MFSLYFVKKINCILKIASEPKTFYNIKFRIKFDLQFCSGQIFPSYAIYKLIRLLMVEIQINNQQNILL